MRVSFRDVLGEAAVAGWTLKRQEKLVGVLMELIGAGVISDKRLERLRLDELGVLPRRPPFQLFVPATPTEPPRASRSAVRVEPSMALDMATPTGKMVPLPKWAKGLASLHVDAELGKVALVEHMVWRHGLLARHEYRAVAEEFKYVVWNDAARCLSSCTFSWSQAFLWRAQKGRRCDSRARPR